MSHAASGAPEGKPCATEAKATRVNTARREIFMAS